MSLFLCFSLCLSPCLSTSTSLSSSVWFLCTSLPFCLSVCLNVYLCACDCIILSSPTILQQTTCEWPWGTPDMPPSPAPPPPLLTTPPPSPPPPRTVTHLPGVMDGRPLRNVAHLPFITASRRLQPAQQCYRVSGVIIRPPSDPPSNVALKNIQWKRLMRVSWGLNVGTPQGRLYSLSYLLMNVEWCGCVERCGCVSPSVPPT